MWILWLQQLAVHCICRRSFCRRGGFEGGTTLFPLVPKQARTCSKLGLTELAISLLDSTVNGELVLLHILLCREPSPAGVAYPGSLLGVNPAVSLQLGLGHKSLLAEIARAGLASVIVGLVHVNLQAGLDGEPLPADILAAHDAKVWHYGTGVGDIFER